MKNTIRILTASLVLASTGYTQTLIGWWRLGEIDPGASSTSGSNATKNPTKDSSGNGWDLTRDATTLTYSSDTPSASQMPISGASTFSMSFDGSSNWGGYSRGVNGNTAVEPTAMTTLAKDFALEAWIKPANTTTGSLPREIIGIGRWDSGVQIMQNGTTLEVSYGSNPTLGGTIKITYPSSVSTTSWTNVAVVVDNSYLTFYVNGTSVGQVASGGGIGFNGGTTSQYFGVGEQSGGSGGQSFVGLIDEVRYFSTGGSFDTSMLNYSAIPEPSTYAALFGLAALGIAVNHRRKRV